MTAPFFSIVMPCFNAARYLPESMASVGAQTSQDFELILVDDGSTDDSLSIARAFRASFSMRVIAQTNGGPAAARNRAIDEASGVYLAFLDADDTWAPEKLASVRKAIDASGPDVVCHDERFVRDGRVIRHKAYGPYTSYLDLLFEGNCLSTSAVAVRRDAVCRAGKFSADRRILGVEDYDLWMRLARAGARIEYLHEELGDYRLHSGNISAGPDYDARERVLIEDHFRSLDDSSSATQRRMMRRRGAHEAAAAYHLLERGSMQAALAAYRSAWRYRPHASVWLKYTVAGPGVWLAGRIARRTWR